MPHTFATSLQQASGILELCAIEEAYVDMIFDCRICSSHVCAIDSSSTGPSVNQLSTAGSRCTATANRKMSSLPISPRRSSAMRRGLCRLITSALSDARHLCRRSKLIYPKPAHP